MTKDFEVGEFFSDPAWQGIGAIAGIISVVITLWLASKPTPKNKVLNIVNIGSVGWRITAVILSLVIPLYAIFVGSILFINILTKTPETIIYGAVAIASLLGFTWGIIWAIYIRKSFFMNNSRRTSRQQTAKQV